MAGDPEEQIPNAAADENPNDTPLEHSEYQALIIWRLSTIEGFMAQSQRGLHNNIVELKKLRGRGEFNEKYFSITGALLSSIEAIMRAHNGFMDAPIEDEATASAVQVPQKKVILSKGR